MASTNSPFGLLIVDVQYDFLPPDGKLAVDGGLDILPHVRKLLSEEQHKWPWEVVVASQDYHPPGHVSFVTSHPQHSDKTFQTIKVSAPGSSSEETDQILWPEHCVQGTRGCELEDSVLQAVEHWKNQDRFHLVQKGMQKDMDAYSAFASSTSHRAISSHDKSAIESSSPLADYLKQRGVATLVICGIATDVCVKATAQDALSCGFEIILVKEAVKGVYADASEDTLLEFGRTAGARVVENVTELEEVLLR